jgi:hypothetical protein
MNSTTLSVTGKAWRKAQARAAENGTSFSQLVQDFISTFAALNPAAINLPPHDPDQKAASVAFSFANSAHKLTFAPQRSAQKLTS